MKKRLTVGLMIHHLDNDYSRAVVRGANAAAEALDINLIIYPGRSLRGEFFDKKYSAYEYQNNVLYDFISSDMLDGLIVSAATIGQFIPKEEFKAFIDRYEGMPVLTIENEVRGYPCMSYGSDGIRLIINHLVHEHNCRNIAFVSGPKNNKDACLRLEAYRTAMLENGLDYDESMVAYGNFSEYTVELVENLIDSCGRKLDAICFANDNMCIGGYTAVQNKGLVPGKDILITGYDDSEAAMSLEPMLTTVKADASVLGYSAVKDMYMWISEGIAPENSELPSNLVVRSSCGCESITNGSNKINNIVKDMTTEEAAHTIVSIFAGNDPGSNERTARSELSAFISRIFTAAGSGGELPEAKLTAQFSELIENQLIEKLRSDTLMYILYAAQTAALKLVGNLHSKQLKIVRMFESFDRIVADYAMSLCYRRQSDSTFCNFLISNIAKDMITFIDDEEKCFYSIMNNLYRIHIRSSYIYVYGSAVINTPECPWSRPETMYLKAYHVGKDLHSLAENEQSVEWNRYLDNEFIVSDERHTMVLSPLFTNEEQYGLLLCDLDPMYFSYIYSITPQVCTAIKLTGLVKKLEGSLQLAENTNNMLNRMSMSDELTGVYNRRGFYKYANNKIHDMASRGLVGVLIFADLDNLKIINDTFGHDEGDYAIRTAAQLLKNGLRLSDIVARIGGDEFAALAIAGDLASAEGIPKRIRALADDHNQNSSKVYNVCVSIGICTFSCDETVDIQQLMDKADGELYKNKKFKNSSILKKSS